MKHVILFLMLIFPLVSCTQQEDKSIHGYVEGDFVMIAPTSSGILKTLSVQRGDHVKVGDELFSLDLTDLTSKQKSAQADIDRFQVEIVNAQKEYDRVLPLSQTGAVSTAKLDDAITKLNSLKSSLEREKQDLVQIEKKLSDAVPVAPLSGIIHDIFYEEGENIPQGRSVVSLLPSENIKVRFFVSQKMVAGLALGQNVSIICDGAKLPILAKISYIASNAEYTPPVIYSVESRDKLVFLVEAKPEEYNKSLLVGLPVSINLGG